MKDAKDSELDNINRHGTDLEYLKIELLNVIGILNVR